MELRNRSRSRTPFEIQTFIEGETFSNTNHVAVTRSTRKTTSVRSTVASSGGISSSNDYIYTNIDTRPSTRSKSTKSIKNVTTSDYSSEEGESTEVKRHISQNEKNQIIEDARRAANGDTEISALNLYRKAGRYWDKYPKTDYTYSPHSRDRIEIAPGVVQMPNMSRKSIHSHDTSTNTESFFEFGSRFIKQKLFSGDESYAVKRVSTSSSHRTIISRFTSFFISIYTVIVSCFYTVFHVQNSTLIWLAKKVHHLASRLMLLDTWLLKRSYAGQKTRGIIALCLLPLLFFAAWWLLWSLGSSIYSAFINPSMPALVAPFLKTETDQKHVQIKPAKTSPVVQATTSTTNNDFKHINTDEIIEKILQSPQIYNYVSSYYNNIKIEKSDSKENEKFINIINELRTEINKLKNEVVLLEKSKNDNFDRILSQVRTENIRSYAHLTRELHRCCNKPVVNLEPHIASVLGKLLNDPEYLSKQKGFSNWLHALFVARHDLEERLSNLTQTLPKSYEISIEDTAGRVMEKVVAQLSVSNKFDPDSFSEERVKQIVKSTLTIYDADKTGLVDYAMEPMGGQVVTTRCTENYHAGTAVVSILGVPLWYPTNSPRTVITPGINPGECWAFQNFPGFLVIKLSNNIKIEAFSLEHINRLLVPGGKIDSAPKDFEVYGLNEENDRDPVKIGEYVYDYNGDPIQYFAAQKHGLVFPMIEIRIKSNHGNPNYTCLYRFRVHGSLSNEPT